MIWHPNLIMPGAAKCGTTTLHDLLILHPEITGGLEKEIRFLMDEGDRLTGRVSLRRDGEDSYKQCFADGGTGNFKYWMDASPQYQYQQTAIDVLSNTPNTPKVMFIFRKPADRLFSLYQFARYQQHATGSVASFSEFIDAIRNPDDPRIAGRRMLQNAWRNTMYDETVEQWERAVGAENLHVTTLEALSADQDATLGALCDWLGIDPAPLMGVSLAWSNPTTHIHNRRLHEIGASVYRKLPKTALVNTAKQWINRINRAKVAPDERKSDENTQLLHQLDAEFAASCERLAERTGITFPERKAAPSAYALTP